MTVHNPNILFRFTYFSVAMTARPMYDMNEYQSVNEHEPPVYTAPNRPGYQDLIVTPSTYQPLVAKVHQSRDQSDYVQCKWPIDGLMCET